MIRTSLTCTAGVLLASGAAIAAPAAAQAAVHGTPTSFQQPVARVAAHHAAASQTKAVVAAIKRSPMLGAVRPADVKVSQIRYAGGAWAGALVTPKHGQTDPAQVLLHKAGGHWTVRDLGTASVGCSLVSQQVRAQLRFHGGC